MSETYLSKREQDVMQILWEAKKPMIASEIVEAKEGLSVPTVHTVLKKLLAKNYIEVADIVQSGKVLARSYRAVVQQEELIKHEVESFMKESENPLSFSKGIMAALLNGVKSDTAVLDELERMIEERRNA